MASLPSGAHLVFSAWCFYWLVKVRPGLLLWEGHPVHWAPELSLERSQLVRSRTLLRGPHLGSLPSCPEPLP